MTLCNHTLYTVVFDTGTDLVVHMTSIDKLVNCTRTIAGHERGTSGMLVGLCVS